MKFEFDTRTDTAKDAAALAAALAVLHGDEVAKVLDAAATRIEADPRAVDGMPAETKVVLATGSANPIPLGEDERRFVADLDTAGVPWDERIHASTKTTNKDGTWTRRRNTDDALFDKVMAELKAGASSQSEEPNAAEAFAPEVAGAGVVPLPPPAATESSLAAAAEPTTSADTAPSSPVPPPPPADPITFPKLMVKITKAQTAGTIDAAKVVEFLGMFGLSAVKELASAPAETIQAVNDLVDAHVGA